MYRRVNSSRFIVLTTAGIVVVMMAFTWVMYGMAQKVFTLTDVMIEMNENFATMTGDIHAMGTTMQSMDTNIADMGGNIKDMTKNIEKMDASLVTMQGDVGSMARSMPEMTAAVQGMSANMGRLTYDVNRASYAFTQPMSYMWGNGFPF